jgi:hypothetical protein
MAIRTKEGMIEAYLFERHIGDDGIDAIKDRLARAPGVQYVAQFVGDFSLFARVVAEDLRQLQRNIAQDYFGAGIRSDWSINLTGSRMMVPKRSSPGICALVRARAKSDPFELLKELDGRFAGAGDYGAAVVTGSGFDILVDLGAETIEDVIDRVLDLRSVPGIGRTSTALSDLNDNAVRPSSA